MLVENYFFADVDECTKFVNPPICGNDSNCSDNIGSYSCNCSTGYQSANGKDNDCLGTSINIINEGHVDEGNVDLILIDISKKGV